MFTVERRDRVRNDLLARARADERIVGAARTGSAARGAEDRWSDIDLFLGVRGDIDVAIGDWSDALYGEYQAVHHFDLPAGSVTYRAFLLPDGLEVDLGFAPAERFGPVGDGAFDVVFGDPVARRPGRTDTDHLVGLGWHHALHARVAIERGRFWVAEQWISALRDHVITLACIRHGLPSAYAKGAHALPADERAGIGDALVRGLDPAELTRARSAAVRAFLAELRHIDSDLTARIARTL
ncbi:MAG TPA: nucleotidyltransferase domain-containing protein [Jatrophihabitantaceae bacterium]|jgi:hypothetical protein